MSPHREEYDVSVVNAPDEFRWVLLGLAGLGLTAFLFTRPPSIGRNLNDELQYIWAALTVFGPLATLAIISLRNRKDMTTVRSFDLEQIGLILSATGAITYAVAIAVSGFEGQTVTGWQGAVGLAWLILCLGCGCLARWLKVGRLAHRIRNRKPWDGVDRRTPPGGSNA